MRVRLQESWQVRTGEHTNQHVQTSPADTRTRFQTLWNKEKSHAINLGIVVFYLPLFISKLTSPGIYYVQYIMVMNGRCEAARAWRWNRSLTPPYFSCRWNPRLFQRLHSCPALSLFTEQQHAPHTTSCTCPRNSPDTPAVVNLSTRKALHDIIVVYGIIFCTATLRHTTRATTWRVIYERRHHGYCLESASWAGSIHRVIKIRPSLTSCNNNDLIYWLPYL